MSIQIPLHIERPSLSSDPVNQMNTFRSYLNVLGDSQSKDESKLKAAQELNDSFDVIIAHSQYQTFLDHAIRVFIKLLQEGIPHSRKAVHIKISILFPIFQLLSILVQISVYQMIKK